MRKERLRQLTTITEDNNIRVTEAKKAKKIQEAILARKQTEAEQRKVLIRNIADGIVAIVIKKVRVNRPVVARYVSDNRIEFYVNRLAIVKRNYLSELTIVNKELEQELEIKNYTIIY